MGGGKMEKISQVDMKKITPIWLEKDNHDVFMQTSSIMKFL